MANILNADDGAISGSAGIKLSSDTSGVLNIQTNGVTAISIAANQVVSFPATVGINFNGQIQFEAGTALIPAIATVADTNTGIYFPGADQIAISTGGTQQFFVGATGDVGIGTGSPSSKLTIKNPNVSGEQNILNIQNAQTTGSIARLSFNQTDDVMRLYNEVLGALAFGTNNAERVRIDSSGNVGIGTGSPQGILHASSTTTPQVIVQNQGGGSNARRFALAMNADDTFKIVSLNDNATVRTDNIIVGNVLNGNVGIGTSSPAYKLDVSGSVRLKTGATGTPVIVSTGADSQGTLRFGSGGLEYSINSGPDYLGTIFNVNGVEGMRLTSTGNLGIGTTSPAAKLHVAGDIYISATSSPKLIFQYSRIGEDLFDTDSLGLASDSTEPITFGTYNSGTATYSERARLTAAGELCIQRTTPTFNSNNRGNITIGGTDSSILFLGTGNGTGSYVFHEQSTAGMEVWNTANGYIRFGTNATERARITAGGVLCLNTATADACLLQAKQYSGSPILFRMETVDSGTQTAIQFVKTSGGTAEVGTITMTTTATAYNTASDIRLKKNIVNAPDSGADVDALQVRSFDWKTDDSSVKYGFVAQELVTVAPEAVKVGDDGDEIEKAWGVDYSKLVPMLVKEIQSLRARVAQLEAK